MIGASGSIHWALYSIPVERRSLPEGAPSSLDLAGLKQGVNDFGNARYDAPQPPKGHGTHPYHFRFAGAPLGRLIGFPRWPFWKDLNCVGTAFLVGACFISLPSSARRSPGACWLLVQSSSCPVLDVPTLALPDEARVEEVWGVARPHVIAQTELVGTYER
jgi:phosphatidylethanolamine-binding protein (PEBP) family uncharacterized protein